MRLPAPGTSDEGAARSRFTATIAGISHASKQPSEAMMPAGSSPKRERQYEHIKDSVEKRGGSTKKATQIAARTVNKERARAGESKTASRTSTKDVSSGHRGGKRSHTGAQGRTKEQLYIEAKKRNIAGRSSMSKAQLERALAH
ncbi:plasmid stabilization protein [Actinoplanes campanulatus]|nr:plasmid stabilization protein [Actinoplanes capillaceus]